MFLRGGNNDGVQKYRFTWSVPVNFELTFPSATDIVVESSKFYNPRPIYIVFNRDIDTYLISTFIEDISPMMT